MGGAFGMFGGKINYADFLLGHLKEQRIWKIWAKMGA